MVSKSLEVVLNTNFKVFNFNNFPSNDLNIQEEVGKVQIDVKHGSKITLLGLTEFNTKSGRFRMTEITALIAGGLKEA